jgi:hypothetical protein
MMLLTANFLAMEVLIGYLLYLCVFIDPISLRSMSKRGKAKLRKQYLTTHR